MEPLGIDPSSLVFQTSAMTSLAQAPFALQNVGCCELQFGQSNLKFASLLSFLTPLIWSKAITNFLPFHVGICAQAWH